MHKTSFHFEYGDALFFSNWILHGKKETYLTCILLVVLGIVYQGIKFARQQYGRKCRNIECRRYILNKGHLIQTVMYVLQFVWGYFIMLSVMTYNVWILISVMLGFGIGYFFFGWGDYEEPSAWSIPKASISRRYSAKMCGATTASSSGTQELLLQSDSKADTDMNRSNSVRCVCDEDEKAL